jgi:hypothetical protein
MVVRHFERDNCDGYYLITSSPSSRAYSSKGSHARVAGSNQAAGEKGRQLRPAPSALRCTCAYVSPSTGRAAPVSERCGTGRGLLHGRQAQARRRSRGSTHNDTGGICALLRAGLYESTGLPLQEGLGDDQNNH